MGPQEVEQRLEGFVIRAVDIGSKFTFARDKVCKDLFLHRRPVLALKLTETLNALYVIGAILHTKYIAPGKRENRKYNPEKMVKNERQLYFGVGSGPKKFGTFMNSLLGF